MKKTIRIMLSVLLACSLLLAAPACAPENPNPEQGETGGQTPSTPSGQDPSKDDPKDPGDSQDPDDPSKDDPKDPGDSQGPDDPSKDDPKGPSDSQDPDDPSKDEPKDPGDSQDPDDPSKDDPKDPDDSQDPDDPSKDDPKDPDEPDDPEEPEEDESKFQPDGNMVKYYDPIIQSYTRMTTELSKAATVQRDITVSGGTLLIYSLCETYEKTSGGYTVTKTEKRLNELGKDKAYEETTSRREQLKAGRYADPISLSLADLMNYPYAGWNEKGGLTFQAQLKKSSAVKIFGLDEKDKMRNIWFTMNFNSASQLVEMILQFDSGDYTIAMTVNAQYE